MQVKDQKEKSEKKMSFIWGKFLYIGACCLIVRYGIWMGKTPRS